MKRDFAVLPVPKRAIVVLLLQILVLPAIGFALVLACLPEARGGISAAGVWIMVLSVVLLTIAMLWSTRRLGIALDGDRLVLRATICTMTVPLAELDVANAQVIDLERKPEWAPGTRTNGVSAGGLYAGHFRARRSGQRLFCLLTDSRRVLALPERNGRLLLMSAAQPQALLESLQRSRA